MTSHQSSKICKRRRSDSSDGSDCSDHSHPNPDLDNEADNGTDNGVNSKLEQSDNFKKRKAVELNDDNVPIKNRILQRYQVINNLDLVSKFDIKFESDKCIGKPSDGIILQLKKTNQFYQNGSVKDSFGIYYPNERRLYIRDTPCSELLDTYGLANNKYWDINHINREKLLFVANKDVKPSEALKAFFFGPTIADCGSVLNACIYQMILNRIGENNFNKVFGNSASDFIISPEVFTEFSSNSSKTFGNPIYDVFDLIPTDELKLNELKHGDIVYIKGVEKYCSKHLFGGGPGEHLICVKDKNRLEPTFLGFGRDNFRFGPREYEEIREMLVDAYNESQTLATLGYIFKHTSDSAKIIAKTDAEYKFAMDASEQAFKLSCDNIGLGTPIIGLTSGVRINMSKIDNLIKQSEEFQKRSWMNVKPTGESKNSLTIVNTIYDTCQKFTDAVCSNSDEFKSMQIGLMIHNMPNSNSTYWDLGYLSDYTKIGDDKQIDKQKGKTHLIAKISREIKSRKKTFVVIDKNFIEVKLPVHNNKISDLIKSTVCVKHIFHDLVIFDSTDIEHTLKINILKEIMKYVFDKKKAILILTYDNKVDFSSLFPQYLNYNDPIIHNFVTISE